MEIENLRNKYKNHPLMRPIIDYCERHDLGFELIKETRKIGFGIKSFKNVNTYYMKIGDSLIQAGDDMWVWDDLIKLLARAYRYLDLDYPDNLIRAEKVFRKRI